MNVLVSLSSPEGDPREYLFTQPVIRIGRSKANDIVIADRHLSGRHALLHIDPSGVVYEDLHSANGSLLARNARRWPVDSSVAHRARLLPGDEVLLGDESQAVRLRVALVDEDREPAAEEPSEVTLVPRASRGHHAPVAELIKDPTESVEVAARFSLDLDAVETVSSSFDREALLALHQHATACSPSLGSEALIEHFARCTLALFRKATHVSVHLREADGDVLSPALMLDRRGLAISTPLSRTVREHVMKSGEAVAFLDSDEHLEASESLRASNVRAGLCAPIRHSGEIMGFAQVDCRGQLLGAFDERDLEVFAVLTHQLAMAHENAQLNERLQVTVSDLQIAQAEMRQLAFFDPLTGLHNRRLFIDRLEQALRSATRSHRHACLLYLDVDQFKRINDSLGHAAGDALLKMLAARLQANVRTNDTVARLGGDEFAIVLGEIDGVEAARTVCEKLLESIRRPLTVAGRTLSITTSVGITLSGDDGADATTLLKNADLALYRAKQLGRNNYQFFTEEMNREILERLALEAELRLAAARGQLVQHYQPLYRLANGRITAVEALLRWAHPTRGLVAPADFIWLAEESGLIVEMGEWVLRTACRTLSAAAGAQPDLGLSVNLSARQLADPGLVDLVRSVLKQTGVPAERLQLEMTESMLMQTDQAIAVLHRLKQIGVRLAIDDFGTGYSSLSYLKELPVDVLKVDRSFVRALPGGTRDTEITTAMIAMAHELRLQVVAEGIETPEQFEFLRRNGCDFGQGYLLGRPSGLTAALEQLPGTIGTLAESGAKALP